MHSIHRAPLKIAAKPPPQPSAPKAVKLKNPWAHRAHPSYEPSSLNLLNPGPSVAHPAAPFRLAALATHPREGGWAGNMEEKNVASNPAYPILWGRKETTTFKLASHRSSGGRGTTKWWRGGRRRRPYKTCGEAATTTLGLKGRQTYKPSGPTGRFILRTFPL